MAMIIYYCFVFGLPFTYEYVFRGQTDCNKKSLIINVLQINYDVLKISLN